MHGCIRKDLAAILECMHMTIVHPLVDLTWLRISSTATVVCSDLANVYIPRLNYNTAGLQPEVKSVALSDN